MTGLSRPRGHRTAESALPPAAGQPTTAQASHETIDGLVAHWAVARPDAVALVAAGQATTYAELDQSARDWQTSLHAMGVRPGDVVTVRLPREPRLVFLLLGLLRCGAAYLAADPSWPEDRVRAALVLTRGPLLVDESDGITDVSTSLLRAGDRPGHRGLHDSRSRAPASATVFLTSGSSGCPKAVLSTHRGAVHVLGKQEFAHLGPGCRMLQAAPLPWDVLTLELWGPLVNGGAVVLANDEVEIARRLRGHIRTDGVDTVWLTASVFHALVDDDAAVFRGLTQVLTGGERLSADHVDRFRAQHPKVTLTNGYGPCEATVFVTTHLVEAAGDDVPLGRPLHGVQLAAPTGPGTEEIVVGGPGLALGYLGDARATAAAFVPAAGGERVYRTGDLGSLDQAGLLRFHGRIDRQLKVRGQRVEPQEVEELVRSALPVIAVAVTPARGPAGEVTGLVAHVVPAASAPDLQALQKVWSTVLSEAAACSPAYLRPQRLMMYERLPRLLNGKLDLARLEAQAVSPPNAMETTGSCHRVLTEVAKLGIRATADEDLLAAGLDSLALIRLLGRLHANGPRFLQPVDVYRSRTARVLAETWDRRQGSIRGTGRQAPGAVPRAVRDMWLHEQLHPGDEGALVVALHQVGAQFDVEKWRRAVAAVAHRHPALGTVLEFDGSTLRRRPARASQLEALIHGMPWPSGCTVTGDTGKLAPGSFMPFELEDELPWRWHFRGHGAGHLLLVVMHHVAVDGWSERIVLEDLSRAYCGVALQPARRSPSRVERLGDDEFWDAATSGAVAPVVPAAASAEPVGPSPSFVLETHVLDGLYGRGLLAWQSGLLAGLVVALRDVGAVPGGRDALVGVAYSGRDDASADEVGLLVDLLPVALTPGLAEVEVRWLAAVENRLGLDLGRVARRTGHLGRTPFSVGFALQPRARPRLELDRCPAEALLVQGDVPPFDVYVEGWPHDLGLQVQVHHSVGSVDHSWVIRLACALEMALLAGLP